jgi:hypothetical protein
VVFGLTVSRWGVAGPHITSRDAEPLSRLRTVRVLQKCESPLAITFFIARAPQIT